MNKLAASCLAFPLLVSCYDIHIGHSHEHAWVYDYKTEDLGGMPRTAEPLDPFDFVAECSLLAWSYVDALDPESNLTVQGRANKHKEHFELLMRTRGFRKIQTCRHSENQSND